jgi:Acetyl-CoA dehydrogenase C-terminal like
MVTALHAFLSASAQQPAEIYRVGLNTTRLLLALGDLLIGWLLARQAEIALGRLDEAAGAAGGRAFYEGKIAAARFFAATVLPRLATERAIAEATTLDLMDLPAEAF